MYLHGGQRIQIGVVPTDRGEDWISAAVRAHLSAGQIFMGRFKTKSGLHTNAPELQSIYQISGRDALDQIVVICERVNLRTLNIRYKQARIGIEKRTNLVVVHLRRVERTWICSVVITGVREGPGEARHAWRNARIYVPDGIELILK